MFTSFSEHHVLPPGNYPMTVSQLRESLLVKGPRRNSDQWDTSWRRTLVDNLEILARQLWHAEISNIFVDGSFVEDKDHPNDIDGYFECDLMEYATGELERKLNLLDPHKVWTWSRDSRRPHPESDKRQLPMWHIYRVELYPHCSQTSGIKDEFGYEQMFPAAFRKSRREHREKGIIKLLPAGGKP